MTIINKILVPTDFSEESINALKLAVGIAKQMNAEIMLLHIIDSGSLSNDYKNQLVKALNLPEGTDIDMEGEHSSLLKEYLRKKMHVLINDFPEVVINENIVFDKVHKHIAAASTKDIGLIVMGSKGISDTTGLLMGSNTEKVIRTAKCPVLAVKQKVTDANVNLRVICFASDFQDVPKSALDLLKTFQIMFGSILHLVKIITPTNFELTSISNQIMKDFVTANQLSNYTINLHNHYTEYEGILAFADEVQADLITLVTHGSTGLMHMLMGSIAEDVANHSKVPVLTFNKYY